MFNIFGLRMYNFLYGGSTLCTISIINNNFPKKFIFVFGVISIDSHTVGNTFSIKVTGLYLYAVIKGGF